MSLNSRYARNIRARRVAEQDGLCCYCKRPFAESGSLRPTIEHRKAKMDGGRDNVANLAAACLHCNRHRGVQKNRARQQAQARGKKRDAGSSPAWRAEPSLKIVTVTLFGLFAKFHRTRKGKE